MPLRLPDWLSYEIRHKAERFRDWCERLHLKDTINDNPKIVAGIAALSLLLLSTVLVLGSRNEADRYYPGGKRAWFYDLNTGTLFTASSKHIGPIQAPSGPLADGNPAGLRAHVYSYVPDPNETERFVGFLEKPDPRAKNKLLASYSQDFEAWARGRLIKRVEDSKWVVPTSREGRRIFDELTRPNAQGQTPMYDIPR